MVFRILLVLSTMGFAFAAPIPVQENSQTCGDVAHRDVVTIMEKRGDEEIEKLAEYFEKLSLGDPHAPSSSTPLGPEHASGSMNDVQVITPPGLEHGPTNDKQTPAPISAPSTANTIPLVETPSPVSTPTSSGYGSDGEFWRYWNSLEEGPEYQGVHVDQLDAGPAVHVDHGTQMDEVQPPLPLPQENGMGNGHQVNGVQQASQEPNIIIFDPDWDDDVEPEWGLWG